MPGNQFRYGELTGISGIFFIDATY